MAKLRDLDRYPLEYIETGPERRRIIRSLLKSDERRLGPSFGGPGAFGGYTQTVLDEERGI